MLISHFAKPMTDLFYDRRRRAPAPFSAVLVNRLAEDTLPTRWHILTVSPLGQQDNSIEPFVYPDAHPATATGLAEGMST